MAGLLDFLNTDDAKLGIGLLAAAGPSMTPMSFGQRLQGAMANMDAQKLEAMKLGLLKSQIDENSAQAQQRTAALELAKRKQAALPSILGVGGGAPAGDIVPQTVGGVPMFSQPVGVTQAAQSAPAGINVQAALAAGYSPEEIGKLDALRNLGKDKVARTIKATGPDGREYETQYDEYGRPVGTPMAQYRAPLTVNQGNQTAFLDPYSLKKLQSLQTFQSPDNAATVAATLRGQNLTDARARETLAQGKTQILNDPNQGPVVVDKSTGVAIPVMRNDGTRLPSDAQTRQIVGSKKALDIINEADKLIGGATGSYLGHGLDIAAQAVGQSTKGAENIAKLKALEGGLMMAQPRMEGPQSDKDVALYRQMAGQIGDPTVPGDIKKAALETIRGLHEKYAGMKPGESKPASAATPPKPMKGMVRGGYRFKGGDPADPASWEKI